MADLSMYYNNERIDVETKGDILKIWVNQELKVTHNLNDGTLRITPKKRWNE